MRGIEYQFDRYENDTKKKSFLFIFFFLFFISLNLATDFFFFFDYYVGKYDVWERKCHLWLFIVIELEIWIPKPVCIENIE